MQAAIREYNVELAREQLFGLVGNGYRPRSGIGGAGGFTGTDRVRLRTHRELAARVQTLTRIHHEEILVTDALRANSTPASC